MGFLLGLSISAAVAQNGIFNSLGKGACREKGDSYLFNAFSYIVCILLFVFLTVTGKSSVFSVAVGLLYGIMNAVANGYKMIALSCGPMHLTTMFTSASMIIPTMSGCLFFGEEFSLPKFIGIIFLLFFIYLSIGKGGDDKKVGKHWLLFCMLSVAATGMIGILQKIHQGSIHKEETGVFLLAAFVCSTVYSFSAAKKYKASFKFNIKHYVLAAVIGLCCFANHYLNLVLSGKIPSQIFFPLVNATPMILTIIMSVTLFKEKITKKQLVGIVGGIASIVCICLF